MGYREEDDQEQPQEHQLRDAAVLRDDVANGLVLREPEPRDHDEREHRAPELGEVIADQVRDRPAVAELAGEVHEWEHEERDRDGDDRVDEGQEPLEVALARALGAGAHARTLAVSCTSPAALAGSRHRLQGRRRGQGLSENGG